MPPLFFVWLRLNAIALLKAAITAASSHSAPSMYHPALANAKLNRTLERLDKLGFDSITTA